MPGDSGIFATCNKGREAKCVGELRDLFAEYAEQLYGDGDDADENENEGTASIENDIQAELAGIQKPPKGQLFVPVKLDVQCGEYLLTIFCLSDSPTADEKRERSEMG
jgi:tRNA acetyltransferase TAN1